MADPKLMRQPLDEQEMVQAQRDRDAAAIPETGKLSADTIIQPKLTIGAPDDIYEREANVVADRVMRMADVDVPAPVRPAAQSTGTIMRELMEEEEEELQAKRAGGTTAVHADASSAIGRLKGGGRPLAAPLRRFYEQRIGADFSQVRIHDGAAAHTAARSVGARAFTLRNDVAFSSGEFAPGTAEGRRLLAHELAHVVQQGAAPQKISANPGPPRLSRASRPRVMRRERFTSTMEICHQVLESREFHVSHGGLRVVTAGQWESSSTNPAVNRFCRPDRQFHIELQDDSWIFDNWGGCDFEAGQPFARQWTNLPEGDYNLIISTSDTGPYCCLSGSIQVYDESGLTGESCTRPPPGPLEILHDGLALAGMVPALGAIADAVDTGIYLIEGNWTAAGISAAAMIPIFGDAAGAARIVERTAARSSRETIRVTSDAVERVGRDGIATGLRDARRAGRDVPSTSTARRVDPDIDEAVERGIVEEAGTHPRPARRPRPSPPGTRGSAAAARRQFDRVRDGYARQLGVRGGGQVHHAVELQVLDRYPGVFSAGDLNAFRNMRGIETELAARRQLHNSHVRRTWDRHYRALDDQIATRGLAPGTEAYNDYVRRYLEDARDEIDYTVGMFFTEVRRPAGL